MEQILPNVLAFLNVCKIITIYSIGMRDETVIPMLFPHHFKSFIQQRFLIVTFHFAKRLSHNQVNIYILYIMEYSGNSKCISHKELHILKSKFLKQNQGEKKGGGKGGRKDKLILTMSSELLCKS